jgi:serine/threonine protein kinase
MPREEFDPLFDKLYAALPNPRLANKNGDTILHIAALYGNFECVKTLIATGAFDINQRNAHKDAPLHYAARGGDDDVVEALLAAGADVRMKGSTGTATQIAQKEDQEHLLPLLEKALSSATADDEDPARLNIVRELLSTEKTYVDSLTTLVEKFGAHFKEKKLLSAEDFAAIFQNAETILSFHRMFLSDLDARLSTWNRHSLLGDLFVRLHSFFKLYMQYINGFDRSAEVLKSSLKHRKFRDAHDNIKRTEAKLLDMASILIMPVQRIPRYSLLLEDLIRKTAATHTDLPQLQAAAAKMRETAGYLNAQKSDADSRARMLALDKQFTNWPAAADKLLQPARGLKFESQKFNIAAADPADDDLSDDVQALIGARDNWLFVFSDLVVVAMPNFRVVGHYPLANSSVVRLAASVSSAMPTIIIAGADAPTLSIWGDKAVLIKLDNILGECVAANLNGPIAKTPAQPTLPTQLLGAFAKPDSYIAVSVPEAPAAAAGDDGATGAAAVAGDAAAATPAADASADKSEKTEKSDKAADRPTNNDDDGDADGGDGEGKSDTLRKRRRRKKKKDATLGREESTSGASAAPTVTTYKLPSFEASSRSVPLPATARGVPLTIAGAALLRVGDSVVWLGGGLPHAVALADGGDAWVAVTEGATTDDGVSVAARSYAATSSDGTTAYVFGGRAADGAALNDLWRLSVVDGALKWSRLHAGGESSAPPKRFGGAATVLGQELYVFGGVGSDGAVLGDLWRYHVGGGAWSDSQVTSFLKPVPRHSSAATSFATFVLVHGGELDGAKLTSEESTPLSDAWAYDTVSKRWTPIERNFGARTGHAFVQLERSAVSNDAAAAAAAPAEADDGSLVVLGGGVVPQNVSGRAMAQVFGALMRRENVLGDDEKKKRGGKLSRMSRVFQGSAGSISSITDNFKTSKGSKTASRSVGGSVRDSSSSGDVQIGAPSNFTTGVSVSRDFEWGDDAHKDFELTRCVGEGGFGSVWHARHRTGGFVVAVKVIRGFRGGTDTSMALSSEIKVLKQCRHQCIVAYYGACFGTDHQILTSRGFMFLDDVLAAVRRDAAGNVVDWCGLKVANYDESRGEIVYDEPVALVVKSDERLVELTTARGETTVAATRNHQLYVATAAKAAPAVAGGGKRERRATAAAFAKHEAGSLLERARAGTLDGVRMLAGAEAGARERDAVVTTTTSVAAAAESELLGYWLGGAAIDDDDVFVRERVARLGMTRAEQVRPALTRDALWRLRASDVASVLVGLHAALGDELVLRDAAARDDVVQLLLHGGFAAHFDEAAGGAGWRVQYDEEREVRVERDAIREIRNEDAAQRVWCFAMPRRHEGAVAGLGDGFVVVRRALKRDATSGVVRSASRATIQGNCSPAADTLWILTEFCALGSLGELMDAIGSPPSELEVACISRDVADGLKYLHDKGIVHRDVKVDNILMNEQGWGMLTDFGLSERIVDAVSSRAGTPHHMAPEVVGKQASSAPSDIWSFGITQIEMYDGRVPNAHLTTKEVMSAIVDSAPPSPVRPQSAEFVQFPAGLPAEGRREPQDGRRAAAAAIHRQRERADQFGASARGDDGVCADGHGGVQQARPQSQPQRRDDRVENEQGRGRVDQPAGERALGVVGRRQPGACRARVDAHRAGDGARDDFKAVERHCGAEGDAGEAERRDRAPQGRRRAPAKGASSDADQRWQRHEQGGWRRGERSGKNEHTPGGGGGSGGCAGGGGRGGAAHRASGHGDGAAGNVSAERHQGDRCVREDVDRCAQGGCGQCGDEQGGLDVVWRCERWNHTARFFRLPEGAKWRQAGGRGIGREERMNERQRKQQQHNSTTAQR